MIKVQAGISRRAECAAIWCYNTLGRLWPFGRKLSPELWKSAVSTRYFSMNIDVFRQSANCIPRP